MFGILFFRLLVLQLPERTSQTLSETTLCANEATEAFEIRSPRGSAVHGGASPVAINNQVYFVLSESVVIAIPSNLLSD